MHLQHKTATKRGSRQQKTEQTTQIGSQDRLPRLGGETELICKARNAYVIVGFVVFCVFLQQFCDLSFKTERDDRAKDFVKNGWQDQIDPLYSAGRPMHISISEINLRAVRQERLPGMGCENEHAPICLPGTPGSLFVLLFSATLTSSFVN